MEEDYLKWGISVHSRKNTNPFVRWQKSHLLIFSALLRQLLCSLRARMQFSNEEDLYLLVTLLNRVQQKFNF